MKQGLSELVCILDRSGSMYRLTSDTINGYNALIEEQKKEEGEAFITTVLFDDKYDIIRDHVPLAEVEPLTDKEYHARGSTALLDAVGRTINEVGARLAATPEDERPEHVIFAITTDGMENSSHEFTRDQIKDMIAHQTDKYSWKFLFLGAGIDAYQEASVNFGIRSPEYVMSGYATTDGLSDVYSSMSKAFSTLRSSAVLDNSWKKGPENINVGADDE